MVRAQYICYSYSIGKNENGVVTSRGNSTQHFLQKKKSEYFLSSWLLQISNLIQKQKQSRAMQVLIDEEGTELPCIGLLPDSFCDLRLRLSPRGPLCMLTPFFIRLVKQCQWKNETMTPAHTEKSINEGHGNCAQQSHMLEKSAFLTSINIFKVPEAFI